MPSKWESRERNAKRLALIVSIMLHIVILVAVNSSTGGGSLQNLIEQVFQDDGSTDQSVSDTKV